MGGNADQAESAAMYDACRTSGINFFDTAWGYNEGRSEEILGELASGERDEVFIATKCGYESARPARIEDEFAESRRRMKVETVDLLYLHRFDPEVPAEISLKVLSGWISSGAVRHVGLSNYAAWQVMKANHVAENLGFGIMALQPMYNLVKRQAEVEILQMAISEDYAVCPYSPLGGGLLTGKYAKGATGRLDVDERYSQRYAPEWMRKAAADLGTLAEQLGVPAATLAIAWVARHPGIWGPIISARSTEQLSPSLAAVNFDMDDALYDRLSALSPAPPPPTDRTEEI